MPVDRYLAAEVRIDHLSDVAGAEADLAHSVSRDATHRKAVKRLKNIYREQARSAEYLNMVEVEAAALGQTKDASRIDEALVRSIEEAPDGRFGGPCPQRTELGIGEDPDAPATPGSRQRRQRGSRVLSAAAPPS